MKVDWTFLSHPLFVTAVAGTAGYLLSKAENILFKNPVIKVQVNGFLSTKSQFGRHWTLEIEFSNISKHDAFDVTVKSIHVDLDDLNIKSEELKAFNLPSGSNGNISVNMSYGFNGAPPNQMEQISFYEKIGIRSGYIKFSYLSPHNRRLKKYHYFHFDFSNHSPHFFVI